jgi:hypothetical protein
MDQETQTQSPEQETPSLALSDLVLLFNVVKIAADRGAIKAEEMSAVGTVYEKLGKFLQSSGVFNQPAPAAPADQ